MKQTVPALVVAVILGGVFILNPIQVSVAPAQVSVNVPPQPTPVVNVNPEVLSPSVTVQAPAVTPVLGAVSGPDQYSHAFFYQGATMGGNAATSSTVATYATAVKDFGALPVVLQWTPNLNTTVSITSTSTFGYVPKIGDTSVIYLVNASTSVISSITLAAGDSGVDLRLASSSKVILGQQVAKITFVRTGIFKVMVLVERMLANF